MCRQSFRWPVRRLTTMVGVETQLKQDAFELFAWSVLVDLYSIGQPLFSTIIVVIY